jgi:glycosyltransferase involved in cell wall biosynthesis
MKITLFGSFFTKPIINELEKKGNSVLFNEFSSDIDLILNQSIAYMYPIQRLMKKIEKGKIKLVNIIPDIPAWRLFDTNPSNSTFNYLRQDIYNFTHKNPYLYEKINSINNWLSKKETSNLSVKNYKKLLDTKILNKTLYLKNFRSFLKKSELNLTFSKFAQKLLKKYLNINSKIWYPCADSVLLNSIPRNLGKKYDAINISRIVPHKHQEIFVNAANTLGLKIVVIGPHQDKSIKLNCPHYPLPHLEALKELVQSDMYVDPSSFEGFGMTPVEAAFLDKITIASDTYVHKEVLKDYPLYFKTGKVKDLVDKLTIVRNGDFTPNRDSINEIKRKYNIINCTNILIDYLESIL